VVHFFAFGSVDAFEQSGDEAFLHFKLGFECGDLGGQFGDLLFGCFDGSLTSK